MKTVTIEEAYKLADWAVREACPALLEYDDGKRRCFPEEAKRLRNLFVIKDAVAAQSAINVLSKEVIPPIAQWRDGQHTVPMRQAHWLCQAAISIEKGICPPMDYGSAGIRDVIEYMRVPIAV